MWLRTARVSLARRAAGGGQPSAFYNAKLALARYYFARMLPQTRALFATIDAGGDTVMSFPREAF
jgi:hypothetical protein